MLYRASPDFVLSAGSHVVTITGGKSCPAAAARGAAVEVSESYTHPTEWYLLSVLLRFASKAFVFGGLAFLLLLEFKRRPNKSPERTRAG